jgi:hypothetical protein
MKLFTLLPCALCAIAFPPLSAAEMEKIVPNAVQLTAEVRQEQRPELHRAINLKFLNRGNAPEKLTITTHWFTTTGDVFKVDTFHGIQILTRTNTSTGLDSGIVPAGGRIGGWVIAVRRENGELLIVKASGQRFEALARTPGALPKEPGPLPALKPAP